MHQQDWHTSDQYIVDDTPLYHHNYSGHYQNYPAGTKTNTFEKQFQLEQSGAPTYCGPACTARHPVLMPYVPTHMRRESIDRRYTDLMQKEYDMRHQIKPAELQITQIPPLINNDLLLLFTFVVMIFIIILMGKAIIEMKSQIALLSVYLKAAFEK